MSYRYIAAVLVDKCHYNVRHDYLHRGLNPRLVLEEREAGGYVWLQPNVRSGQFEVGKKYDGYWCNNNGHREVKFEVIIITKD